MNCKAIYDSQFLKDRHHHITESEALTMTHIFFLGALGQIKFLVQFRIVRSQVPASGDETGRQNYLQHLVYHQNSVTLKSDTSFRGMYQFCIGNYQSEAPVGREKYIQLVILNSSLRLMLLLEGLMRVIHSYARPNK
ncbi:hypothetical protein TNCV_4263011 [Trichonephila clavipes]|nr:hypothetical protein TNCV_4263011 [Trichonephila clavipes]